MYALKVARGLYSKSNGLRNKLTKSAKRSFSLRGHVSAPSLVSIKHHHKIQKLNKKSFHSSRAPRWQTPDQLSTSELRSECEKRSLSTKGSRTALVERLTVAVQETGGYDNGLTVDDNLATKKRQIETEMNKIKDTHYSVEFEC